MIRYAPAKINFGLWIGPRRDDGYHPVSTILVPVSLYDTVHVELQDGIEITFECSDPAVPAGSDNLCWKAAKLFLLETGIKSGVYIKLEKNIPVGAGLGGGSSDAAAVLLCLSQLHAGIITDEKLISPRVLGARLGADVPFFLFQRTCAASGIGEILKPFDFPWKCSILLVIPSYSISTTNAYEEFDRQLKEKPLRVDYADALQSLDYLKDARENIRNDFETVLFPLYPDLEKIKRELYEAGAGYASLTGSGSVVYGIFENENDARKAESHFKKSCRTEIVTPIL